MLSKISHHARSVLQHAPAASLSRLPTLPVPRTGASGPSQQLAVRGIGAASRLARHFTTREFILHSPRDWPADVDPWDGGHGLSAEGAIAHHAAMEAPSRPPEGSMALERWASRHWHFADANHAVDAVHFCTAMTMEREREELLRDEELGVQEGLRALDIGPGDVVAEQDPQDPVLAVRLALDGARSFITTSRPECLRAHQVLLENCREGRPFWTRTLGKDSKPRLPSQHYADSADLVAKRLTVVPGDGFARLPQDLRYKALISRHAFDFMPLPDIHACVRDAGRLLQPGGGLVFRFSHAAGRPAPASAGVRMNSTEFQAIEQAVNDASLGLQTLYVSFIMTGFIRANSIPIRRVLPDADGRIPLRKADAAVWSGWNEIFQFWGTASPPAEVHVSGLFVKDGKEDQ